MGYNVGTFVFLFSLAVYTITNKNSIRKIRYVDEKSNQLVLRVDEHDFCRRIDWGILQKIQDNKCSLPMSEIVDVDAIIISDYDKGFLEEEVQDLDSETFQWTT